MTATISDGHPMVNEEYGIAATFPLGSRVCPGLSGSHPHGFYTRLGDRRAECFSSTDQPRATTIGIWADSNAAFWRTPEQAVGEDCDQEGVGAPYRPTLPDGMATAVCRTGQTDGTVRIEVTALAGQWPEEGDAEADGAPRIIYRAYLVSSPETLEADKVRFQFFLDRLVLTPPQPFDPASCVWTRGELFIANGTPSVRIRVEGTGRLLGITSHAGAEADDVLPANARTAIESRGDVFSTRVTGAWRVCPRAPDRAGHMRPMELIEARDLTVIGR